MRLHSRDVGQHEVGKRLHLHTCSCRHDLYMHAFTSISVQAFGSADDHQPRMSERQHACPRDCCGSAHCIMPEVHMLYAIRVRISAKRKMVTKTAEKTASLHAQKRQPVTTSCMIMLTIRKRTHQHLQKCQCKVPKIVD